MRFFSSSNEDSKKFELIVLPFWQGKKQAEKAAQIDRYASHFAPLIRQDFLAKEGQILVVYDTSTKEGKRLALIGLGAKEKIDTEKLRRIYAKLTRLCHQKNIKNICLFCPQLDTLAKDALLIGISEGILLSNYNFEELKQATKADPSLLLQQVTFMNLSKQELAIAQRCGKIAEGVYMARDLVNRNADEVTPQYLSSFAKAFESKLPHVKATILNKKLIEKEKLGLLLAVNRGSTSDPAMIILSYQGDPLSKEHTILIGKGITYDTGGLNLKPVVSMETMKADMAGGAAVLGTLYAAASLELKVNLTVVVPATENSISSTSFKPGDVYRSCKGLTIEVNNPDAEGRLVLADAITYAIKYLKPTRLIDVATLTGGIDVALGSEACGLFSNNDDLANALMHSGSKTFERVWRLPLYEEYHSYLKSDIADIKNSAGRSASSITAAMFLQEFVEETPWAHLDIASTAFFSEKKRYHPKYATGFGVRLLIDFLSAKN
ncbi:putative cytosol aminopeptidase|uniref:leucyl aminopeptidase n=1 Tax=Neochlamydia sp. AcF84 TaxID=2315858 RepID=UPI00140B85A1|nr:leucyl aminopeptidase [Neochlamydia sp. AcF84]NGY95682.1 putative cytosol aminopeptidase [Neochlamydia sp. AcF84]